MSYNNYKRIFLEGVREKLNEDLWVAYMGAIICCWLIGAIILNMGASFMMLPISYAVSVPLYNGFKKCFKFWRNNK